MRSQQRKNKTQAEEEKLFQFQVHQSLNAINLSPPFPRAPTESRAELFNEAQRRSRVGLGAESARPKPRSCLSLLIADMNRPHGWSGEKKKFRCIKRSAEIIIFPSIFAFFSSQKPVAAGEGSHNALSSGDTGRGGRARALMS
jgi:hypothetical protein